MSFLNLTHSDIAHGGKMPFGLREWLKKADRITSLDSYSLMSVAVITGYLLAIAALTLASLSGGFPWFVVMLVVFLPLYALMAEDSGS